MEKKETDWIVGLFSVMIVEITGKQQGMSLDDALNFFITQRFTR